MATIGCHPKIGGENSGVVQMWFEIGEKVTWTPERRNRALRGTIITILKPGERAEDILSAEDCTRLSIRNRNQNKDYIPITPRALVKVVDVNEYVTFHTPNLKLLTKVKEITKMETMDKILMYVKNIEAMLKAAENKQTSNIVKTNAILKTLR
jgi:hypothetical protein